MGTDYVDQVAGAIIKQLQEGTAPWQKPWKPGERFMPYNPTTGNEYRGANALWLMSQSESKGFGDARWMTYRQAQEQDAQVTKGQKGTAIQYWKWQGLEPVKDASGKQWVLRTIQKYPERGLPPTLRPTIAKDILQDQVSASHPYAALVVPPLAEAASTAAW